MKTATVKQIQKLDALAINQYGFPSLILMENAGRRVFEEIQKKFRPANVVIICGYGNNAGDGLVIARHFHEAGIKTQVVLVGQAKQLKPDALVHYQILKRLKYSVKEISHVSTSFLTMIKNADVVVDAIFGVGLNRNITDPFKSFIEAINHQAKKIVAVDIPSGLDGTTGQIYGVCIKADLTVTFSFSKRGFYQNDGPKYTGKVIVADIGIPNKLKNKI